MGCDIHPICQYREPTFRNWWRHGGVPCDDRNYIFFSQLADVRTQEDLALPPLAPQLGLPDGYFDNDESPELTGDHSTSWCSLPEMQAYFEAPLLAEGARGQWEKWVTYGEFIATHHEVPFDHVRFVFNFDN